MSGRQLYLDDRSLKLLQEIGLACPFIYFKMKNTLRNRARRKKQKQNGIQITFCFVRNVVDLVVSGRNEGREIKFSFTISLIDLRIAKNRLSKNCATLEDIKRGVVL